MEGNQLIERYRSQIRIFREYHKKISANPDMEDIHQLRLSIKRLRALLNLMETVSHREFKQTEHLVLFGSLFREAGKLREAQVNESLINSCGINIPPGYPEYLKAHQTETGMRLQEELKKFNFEQLKTLDTELENKINLIPEQDIVREAETEVLHQMRMIQDLREKPVSRKKLHKIRMRLKVVMELLNLILNSTRFSDLGILEQSCTQLTKQLGKWHDLEMLLRSLRDFRLEALDEKASKKVRKAVKLVQRDSARHKNKILKSLVKELP